MNFIQIIDKLETYAKTIPFVNNTTTGDIYENLNGKADVKYATVNIDITESTVEDNIISYTVYLYFVDRLNEDRNNWKEIKTTANYVLQSIVNYAINQIGDVTNSYSINYFEQQFADYCAGGYVQFNLEVENTLGECLIDEYQDNPPQTISVAVNGQYYVDTPTYFEINVPSVSTQEMTQAEYDELTEYDQNKIYLISE